MHGVYIVNAAQFERVVRQECRQVMIVIAGQLVVQARQGITCWVWQPEARIARIATSCRVGGVRCGETCATNNDTLHTAALIKSVEKQGLIIGSHATCRNIRMKHYGHYVSVLIQFV